MSSNVSKSCDVHEGCTTLTTVHAAFVVFHSAQGKQGWLGRASNQQLDNTFGTHNETDVALIILEKGVAQPSEDLHSERNFRNETRGEPFLGHGKRGSAN